MILVRAPLRISFVGGGTDISGFYKKHQGAVLSATIDKYVYVAVNSTPLIDNFVVKYQKTESVKHPSELEHPSIRETLLDLDIVKPGIEIASFADLPSKTGLGSSSSFAVALVKALSLYKGNRISQKDAADMACRIEIDLLKEPIGKQDQYAASVGGFNTFRFNKDESVDIEPLLLGFKEQSVLESHSFLFFTGITEYASSVLKKQGNNIDMHVDTYKKMAQTTKTFGEALMSSDMKKVGEVLLSGWENKKSLEKSISNEVIDKLYDVGLSNGAYGGKLLGAGGRGCLYFIAPPEKHAALSQKMSSVAEEMGLVGYTEIPVHFVQTGTDVLLDSKHHKDLN